MNSWRSKPIGDLMTFVPTGSHSRNDMTNNIDGQDDSIYNIHYGDIHVKYSTYIDFDNTAVPVLKPDISYRSQMLLRDGDLIMADASEDYEGVGASVEVKNIGKRKAIAGLHTYAMRNESNELAPGYAALLLRNALVHRRLTQAAVYSKVFGVTKSSLVKIEVDLPPKPEQERIVSVLEVWDEYLEKLDQKIALKEELKKGLMQQLLTGKKRLPGFNDKYVYVRIGDLGSITTGNTPSMQDRENYGNEYYWATAEDFNGKYINKTKIMLSEKGKNNSRIVPRGSVLITCIASIGKNAISNIALATNQQINSITLGSEYSNEFFYYYLSFNNNLLLRYAGAGALPILNKGDFSRIKISIPHSKDEQKQIADILSSLDTSIDLSRKIFEQILNQKKYLLKKLITGRIRTPENLTHKKECINA